MLEGGYLFFTAMMLLYNTVRDMRTREIDSRFNFMAIGATIMLLIANRPGWLILGFAILTAFCLGFLLKKHFASGDREAMGWIVLGLAIINPAKVFIFLFVFLALTTLSLGLSLAISKRNDPTSSKQGVPGYVAILGSYVLVALL